MEYMDLTRALRDDPPHASVLAAMQVVMGASRRVDDPEAFADSIIEAALSLVPTAT